MKRVFAFLVLICVLLSSCNSASRTTKPEQLTIQYTAASVPWLASLYNCASGDVVTTEQRAADFLDPQSANMVIRIGQPDNHTSFTYQIGTENLLVILNLKNPTRKLTADQVRRLFSGQIQNWKTINGTDAPIQAWIFPSGEDIQEIFNQSVLDGSPVSSVAHLANNPDEMLQAVERDVNSIGIITRRWKNGNVSGIYTVASSLPVMAITLTKPQGTLAYILACMQK